MTRKSAWKKTLSREQRLELYIQESYRTLRGLGEMRGIHPAPWLNGMIRHYARVLREYLRVWEDLYGEPYDFKHPLNYDLCGLVKKEEAK